MNALPASDRTRRAVGTTALLLGIAADLLLRGRPLDGHASAWIALTIAAWATVAYRENLNLPRATWAWLVGTAAISATLGLRAAPFLQKLTLAGGLGGLALAAWAAHGGNAFRAPITEFFRQALLAGLHAATGAAAFLARPAGMPPRLPSAPATAQVLPRVILGSLVSMPLLLLFGTLFASADPVFRRGIRAVTEVDLTSAMLHIS
ncbi:MAG: hypothetical protein IT580_17895, partial [Verrucomicrobiales bacterium]|nr:hypothetical protein [Verrucomicrobiales bacterium]